MPLMSMPHLQSGQFAQRAAQSEHPDLWRDLVAAWPIGMLMESGMVHDTALRRSDLTLANATWGYGTDNRGRYLSFNGTSAYGSCSNVALSTTDPEPLSVILEFRTSVYSATNFFFSLVNPSAPTTSSMSVGVQGSDKIRILKGSRSTSVTFNTANTWVQATAIWETTALRHIYIDGVLGGSNAQSATGTGMTVMSIGNRNATTPDGYYTGDLRYIYVYKRVVPTSLMDTLRLYPYAPFVRRRRIYKATAVTRNLLANVQIASSTPAVDLVPLRNLKSNALAASSTASSGLSLRRNLRGVSTLTSVTTDIDVIIATARNILSSVSVVTSTAALAMSLRRNLLANGIGASNTGAFALSVLRNVMSSPALGTSSSAIAPTLRRNLLSAPSLASSSSSIELMIGVFYSLVAQVLLSSGTSAADMALLRNAVANGLLASSTGTAALSLRRNLSSNSLLASLSTDIDVLLVAVHNLLAQVTLASSTGNVDVMLLRNAIANALVASSASDADLSLRRNLSSTISLASSSSSIELMIGVFYSLGTQILMGTSTGLVDLGLIRNTRGSAILAHDTASVVATLRRHLTGSVPLAPSSSTVSATVRRQLRADLSAALSTSDAALTLIRNILSNGVMGSLTSAIDVDVFTFGVIDLLVSSQTASLTSGISPQVIKNLLSQSGLVSTTTDVDLLLRLDLSMASFDALARLEAVALNAHRGVTSLSKRHHASVMSSPMSVSQLSKDPHAEKM